MARITRQTGYVAGDGGCLGNGEQLTHPFKFRCRWNVIAEDLGLLPLCEFWDFGFHGIVEFAPAFMDGEKRYGKTDTEKADVADAADVRQDWRRSGRRL